MRKWFSLLLCLSFVSVLYVPFGQGAKKGSGKLSIPLGLTFPGMGRPPAPRPATDPSERPPVDTGARVDIGGIGGRIGGIATRGTTVGTAAVSVALKAGIMKNLDGKTNLALPIDVSRLSLSATEDQLRAFNDGLKKIRAIKDLLPPDQLLDWDSPAVTEIVAPIVAAFGGTATPVPTPRPAPRPPAPLTGGKLAQLNGALGDLRTKLGALTKKLRILKGLPG